MKYYFRCNRCGYHCESLTKEKNQEAKAAHRVKQPGGGWVCANLKQHSTSKVIRRSQIVSTFEA